MSSDFVRTKSGLANAHLFYDADFIVYCESHPGRAEEMSWDLGFWRKILSHFAPGYSYVFKPQGGKSGIMAIADTLSGISGHKSICLVDRDFSDIHKTEHSEKYVVSTYGYAFENDICDPHILASAIDLSLPGLTSLTDLRAEVDALRLRAKSEFRHAVSADALLSLYFSSLFDREGKKYKSLCLVRGATSVVRFSRKNGLARLAQQRAKITIGRPIGKPQFDSDTWRRMLGHLCWWINYRICRNVMAKHGFVDQLSEDTFAGICLNFFALRLDDKDWVVRQHYAGLIPDAFAAAA